MSYQNIIPPLTGNGISIANNGNLAVVSGSPSFTSSEISFKIQSVTQPTGTFSVIINKVINPPATKSYTVFTNVVIKDSLGFSVMSKPSGVLVAV